MTMFSLERTPFFQHSRLIDEKLWPKKKTQANLWSTAFLRPHGTPLQTKLEGTSAKQLQQLSFISHLPYRMSGMISKYSGNLGVYRAVERTLHR